MLKLSIIGFVALAVHLFLGSAESQVHAGTFPGISDRIAFVSNRDGDLEIYAMDPDGSNPVNLSNDPGIDLDPSWSPDSTKVAFTSYRDGNYEVYVMDADGSNQVNVSDHPSTDLDPTWSPDGASIAFATFRDGNYEIYTMSADGSSQSRVTFNFVRDSDPSWSPDGTRIAFTLDQTGAGTGDLYVIDTDGTDQLGITSTPFPTSEYDPSWSPDGTRIAFTRTAVSGAHRIYVANANGGGEVQLTNTTAYAPSWSPDGTRLAFVAQDDIYVMNADGTGQVNISNNAAWDSEPDWGARLLNAVGGSVEFVSRSGEGGVRWPIYVIGAMLLLGAAQWAVSHGKAY